MSKYANKWIKKKQTMPSNQSNPKNTKLRAPGKTNCSNNKIQCHQCPRSFVNNHGLKIHNSRMHSSENNPEGRTNTNEAAEDDNAFTWGNYDAISFERNLYIMNLIYYSFEKHKKYQQ